MSASLKLYRFIALLTLFGCGMSALGEGPVVVQGTREGSDKCTVPAFSGEKKDYDKEIATGAAACLKALFPTVPIVLVGTPGAFFIGRVWGSSTQWVYGPQVGVSGVIQIPLVRPGLDLVGVDDKKWSYQLPREMSFVLSLDVSLSANLAAFSFPQGTTASGTSTTQSTPNIGVYIGPEFGWRWWNEKGNGGYFGFQLGLLAGYVDTQATGSGFALGIQPAIVFQPAL
jgi:hypothetical protein